ncbi:MAG: glycine--tRNA ligase [Chlamydiota bacterium]|jgi:glycyl-tRNA synthetase
MSKKILDPLKPIVALCKRRGFIYPGSEIYGGFANTYSYGPYGVELKRNIQNLWWKTFVQSRTDIVGLDGPILLHPKTWEASGHLGGFSDVLIDCKTCKARIRADHLIEQKLNMDVEGKSPEEITAIIQENKLTCPKCGEHNFTDARHFNLMFSTQMSKTNGNEADVAYLRPETAQAIFLDYKNVVDTTRVKLPFGIAQIGKAFRNEITPGNFVFRLIEFEQMEIEYFIREEEWENSFENWLEEMKKWCSLIGLKKAKIQVKEHAKEKLSHYSKRTVDIVYDFPFGVNELYGLAYRTDFDLSRHSEESGHPLYWHDLEKKEKVIPHVIEPTFGVDRTILALLCDAFEEETLESGETRNVLHFDPKIAPIKVAIFPLMKKPELIAKAKELFQEILPYFATEYDETGAIGKRYRRQDELGTPFCVTIDYDTLEDNTVTLRERDSMKQIRIPITEVRRTLLEKI